MRLRIATFTALLVSACSGEDADAPAQVEVDPAPYAEGCTTSDDCVAVRSQWSCACASDGCLDGAVLKDRQADFDAAKSAAKQECDAASCEAPEHACYDDLNEVVCAGGTCQLLAVPECIEDADCTDENAEPRDWNDPAAVQCIGDYEEGVYRVLCRECGAEGQTCPAGTSCDGVICR